MQIKNETLGVDYTLPDLTQRDLEKLLRTSREIQAGLIGATPEDSAKSITALLAALRDNKIDLDKEQFSAVLREHVAEMRIVRAVAETPSDSEAVGVLVRSAARCGWLEGLAKGDVDDLKPAAANLIGLEIRKHIEQSSSIPPE
jgi:hypothetical protein